MTPAAIFEELAARRRELAPCMDEIEAAYRLMLDCFRAGGKFLICGNGGSAAEADHLVAELMKGFRLPRPLAPELRDRLGEAGDEAGRRLAGVLQAALPALSLCAHTALLTAIANDQGPEAVFAQQVAGYGRPGDLLACLSTSGSSANVVQAARIARALGIPVIGLIGRQSGELETWCAVTIRAPADATPDIQELHLAICHGLAAALEAALFG